MGEQIFVENIKCGGCAATIQNALTTFPGIKVAEVDVATGRIDISGDAYSLLEVQQKLADLGYPVRPTT